MIVPDNALLVFFNRKYSGFVPESWAIETVVGSNELDTVKSIGSSIIKPTPEGVEIFVFSFIYKA